MNKLKKDGYEKFLKEYFEENRELFKNLSNKQHPETMIITCSDSRINPALLLDAKPGELFINRNIGNVVPSFEPIKGATQAAIEYAVNVINVHRIVILGHSNCGACAHMYHEPKPNEPKLPHVESWLRYLNPAKSAAMLEVHANHKKNIFELTEKHNIVTSLQRLMEYPYIQERIINNEIELLGWWYDIGTGKIETYDFNTHQFTSLIKKTV